MYNEGICLQNAATNSIMEESMSMDAIVFTHKNAATNSIYCVSRLASVI